MAQTPLTDHARDPHRHGSESITGYASRKANTNPKYGFNCVPARAPAGRLAKIQGPPNRGAGKVVGRNEQSNTASNCARNKEISA